MTVEEIVRDAAETAGIAEYAELSNKQRDRLVRKLNLKYREIYDAFPWRNIKVFNLSLTTSVGTVIFPYYVDTIITGRQANQPLYGLNEQRVNLVDPLAYETSGETIGFTATDSSPVLTPLTASSVLKFASTSAADTSTQKVFIKGLVSGKVTTEVVDLNGLTEVTSVNTYDIGGLSHLSKPITTGRISVRKSDSVEIGYINPGDTSPNYLKVFLVNPPSESTTYHFNCVRRFERLVSDYDSPVIPGITSPLLYYVMAEASLMIGDSATSQMYHGKGNSSLKAAISREDEVIEDKIITPVFGNFGNLGEENLELFDLSIAGRSQL